MLVVSGSLSLDLVTSVLAESNNAYIFRLKNLLEVFSTFFINLEPRFNGSEYDPDSIWMRRRASVASLVISLPGYESNESLSNLVCAPAISRWTDLLHTSNAIRNRT